MDRKKVLIVIIIFTLFIILLISMLDFQNKFNNIMISENKWNSIVDTRNENTNLVLRNIKFNDYHLIIDEKNSTIYYSLINDSATKYSPKVSFKTDDNQTKIAVLSDEITDDKISNNHEFKIMIYNNSQYHVYNLMCTSFPILNIKYHVKEKNKKRTIPIEIYLFNNLSNTPNRIMRSAGKLKTLDDGKSYLFSLLMVSPGKNERENKISIFNMDPHSEYILSAVDGGQEIPSFSDETNEETVKENHPVELFINNEYIGLYLLKYNVEK